MTANFPPTWRGRPIPVTRSAIENEIERLIDLLDVADPDPDAEPSLGWADFESRYAAYPKEPQDDRELEDENDEDGGDAEPEETDENGDEQDSSRSEDDNVYGGVFMLGRIEGGSGA